MKFDRSKVFAVIMAGGKGERLWPLSTEDRPKPLIALNGQQTLLEDTVQRLFPLLNAENVFVITDEKSAVQAQEILMLPAENIIAEPCRRNTAPCIALAAAMPGGASLMPRGVPLGATRFTSDDRRCSCGFCRTGLIEKLWEQGANIRF